MPIPNTPLAGLAFALTVLTAGEASAHPEPTRFAETAFIEAPEMVDCTHDDGTQTRCPRITVGYLPERLEIGSFCTTTPADIGGIWEWAGDNAGRYWVDRDFPLVRDDLGYRFFDEDGTVHIAIIATAQPEDDHAGINVSPDERVEITTPPRARPLSCSRLGPARQQGSCRRSAASMATATAKPQPREATDDVGVS